MFALLIVDLGFMHFYSMVSSDSHMKNEKLVVLAHNPVISIEKCL